MPGGPELGESLGLVFGLAVGVSIFAANFAAARPARGSQLVDILIRLAVFGVIAISAAELVGHYFAPLVQAQAGWFWSAFALGFVAVPAGLHLILRGKGRAK